MPEKEIDLTKENIILSEEETNEVLKDLIENHLNDKDKQEVLNKLDKYPLKDPEDAIKEVKKKGKLSRWLEAIKNPSQKTIMRNQWAFSFGFALGTFGLMIFSFWNAWHSRTIQSYLWAVLGVCGFGITYWQVKAIGNQMKMMNADFNEQLEQMKKMSGDVK